MSDQTRSLVSVLVIAGAVCGGLYAFVASPIRERAARAESELQRAQAEFAASQNAIESLPVLLEAKARAEEQVVAFGERGAPARDETALFALVTRLAEESGVGLTQVVPSQVEQPAWEAEASIGTTTQMRCTLAGSGSFGGVSAFLRRLESPVAFVSVTECRLAPNLAPSADAPDHHVLFSLALDFYAFETEMALEQGEVYEP